MDTYIADLTALEAQAAGQVTDALADVAYHLAAGDPVCALSAARWAAQEVEALERSLVRHARSQDASWGAIGFALGVSRQAAHERYSGPDLA
jgi:hypothetical protein